MRKGKKIRMASRLLVLVTLLQLEEKHVGSEEKSRVLLSTCAEVSKLFRYPSGCISKKFE